MLIDRGQIYATKVVLGCLPINEYDGSDDIYKDTMKELLQEKIRLNLNLFYYMYTKDKKWYDKVIDNFFSEYITWYGTSSTFIESSIYILEENYLYDEDYKETDLSKVGIYEKKLSLSLQQNIEFFSREEVEDILLDYINSEQYEQYYNTLFDDFILMFKDICKNVFNYEFKEFDSRILKPYGASNVLECVCIIFNGGHTYISSFDISDLTSRCDIHIDYEGVYIEFLDVKTLDFRKYKNILLPYYAEVHKEFNYENPMEEFNSYMRGICRISL